MQCQTLFSEEKKNQLLKTKIQQDLIYFLVLK